MDIKTDSLLKKKMSVLNRQYDFSQWLSIIKEPLGKKCFVLKSLLIMNYFKGKCPDKRLHRFGCLYNFCSKTKACDVHIKVAIYFGTYSCKRREPVSICGVT